MWAVLTPEISSVHTTDEVGKEPGKKMPHTVLPQFVFDPPPSRTVGFCGGWWCIQQCNNSGLFVATGGNTAKSLVGGGAIIYNPRIYNAPLHAHQQHLLHLFFCKFQKLCSFAENFHFKTTLSKGGGGSIWANISFEPHQRFSPSLGVQPNQFQETPRVDVPPPGTP